MAKVSSRMNIKTPGLSRKLTIRDKNLTTISRMRFSLKTSRWTKTFTCMTRRVTLNSQSTVLTFLLLVKMVPVSREN